MKKGYYLQNRESGHVYVSIIYTNKKAVYEAADMMEQHSMSGEPIDVIECSVF